MMGRAKSGQIVERERERERKREKREGETQSRRALLDLTLRQYTATQGSEGTVALPA
jgi:hypothetical protein